MSGLRLGHLVANPADQECRRVIFSHMGAGDEGVEPFDLVGEAVAYQKIQRPVGDGWLRAQPLVAQHFEDIVGAERTVPLKEYLQHPPAYRRKLQPLSPAERIGRGDTCADAASVVVGLELDHVLNFLTGAAELSVDMLCYYIYQVQTCYSITTMRKS